jgi:hypothetical protein
VLVEVADMSPSALVTKRVRANDGVCLVLGANATEHLLVRAGREVIEILEGVRKMKHQKTWNAVNVKGWSTLPATGSMKERSTQAAPWELLELRNVKRSATPRKFVTNIFHNKHRAYLIKP